MWSSKIWFRIKKKYDVKGLYTVMILLYLVNMLMPLWGIAEHKSAHITNKNENSYSDCY